jgi:hypothetical protein
MTRVSRALSFLAVLLLMFSVIGSEASAQEAGGQGAEQGSVDQEEEGEKQDEPRVDEDGEGQEGPETKEDGEADEDGEAGDPASSGATTRDTGDPQGVAARGTVKIEETPIVADTPNEVHAGCSFGLSFFGFREQTAPVVFTLQPPSGSDEIARREVALQEAQGNELSGTLAVDLTDQLAGYAPVQADAYDYKVRVDVVVGERGESGLITKTAMVFLECPEAAARAIAAGFVRLPVSGEAPGSGQAPASGEASPSVQASGGARVPVGGVATGAGGMAGDRSPIAPLAGLAALVLAFTAVLRLRSASTS